MDMQLPYRQQAAQLIENMGQKLKVTRLCISTAIVYMHRFYAFHSFTMFHVREMAVACLFLACKMEEQPRAAKDVIKMLYRCLHPDQPSHTTISEIYQREQDEALKENENALLMTLGFSTSVEHPHMHIIRCCGVVRASKDVTKMAYFLASSSLCLTTMCLQYKPTVVACVCIHLACKWLNWKHFGQWKFLRLRTAFSLYLFHMESWGA